MLVEVGRDESLATISVSIFSLGGIVAALGIGLLIDRFGAMRTLISFVVTSAVLLFVVGQMLASASTELLLVLLGACGFFVLGAYGGVNVVLASFYPESLRAVGIGWAKSVGRIGTVIAPVLIGIGLSAGIAETTVMSLFALPALVAAGTLADNRAVCAPRIMSVLASRGYDALIDRAEDGVAVRVEHLDAHAVAEAHVLRDRVAAGLRSRSRGAPQCMPTRRLV